MNDFEDADDGCDEIANVSNRQTADEEFEASGGQLSRYSKTGPGSPVKGQPIRKLADLRWTDHLDPNEDLDVIRLAKTGDPSAIERLVRCYQKTIIDIAGQTKYNGPAFEDRLSSGWRGFWKALAGYNLQSNNGFYAYAVKFIVGAVCDCVTDWHYRGHKDESNAAREERAKHRPIHVEYNGVEGSHYDLEGHEPISAPIGGYIASDEQQRSWDESSARAQLRLSKRLATLGRNLGVPRECIGIDENPYRNGGRVPRKSRFPIPRFEGRDDGRRLTQAEYLGENPTPDKYKIAAPSSGNAPALGIIGYLAKDADDRALRRLKQVGRVQFAQELAAKDRYTVANRPLQRHLYADAVPKPVQFVKSRYAPITEEMLAHGQAKLAHPVSRPTARVELTQHTLKSKLRLIKGIQHGKFNQPGTLNHAVHGHAVHRHDGGNYRDVRKVGRAGS